jgi:hypothetical protein
MKWENCNFLRIYKHRKLRTNEEIIDGCFCRQTYFSDYDDTYRNCDKEKCIHIKTLNLLEELCYHSEK